MNREKVTSLDVAARAGVSQSAVSRVFSGASASRKTIEKVRKAADELGYRPNVLARSLITGQSRIIGLVVAYLENQFYPVALERLSNALQEQGYHILVFMASGRGEGVDRVIGELLDYQVDGIITASVGLSDELTARCEAAGIPVVMFNRGQEDMRLAQVTSKNKQGGYKVGEFLVAGGHKRIGHVSGWQGSSTGRDRQAGFERALADAGATCVATIDGLYQRDAAADAARKLVEDYRVDAIFVGNDHMAFGVMDMLRCRLGLSVPDDVSIVGYDDVPMADWDSFRLTTMRQPVRRMVDATVTALLAAIQGKATPAKFEIESSLILRDSARIPEGWT